MTDGFDRELHDLPPALRWREWLLRLEAALFAAAEPVSRDQLARLAGRDCVIEDLLEDLALELQDRPYELARVAGGWQLRTRSRYAPAIRAAFGAAYSNRALTRNEALVLTIIACLQPVTRAEIARLTGREVGRELIARLHRADLIARGPRSPEPGAPYTYVTTRGFLTHFGLESLRDLPDLEAMADAGLLTPLADPGLDLPISPAEGEG